MRDQPRRLRLWGRPQRTLETAIAPALEEACLASRASGHGTERLPGAITTFSADAEAVTVGGTWSVTNLSPSELKVTASRFARNAQFVSCEVLGYSTLEAFDADPPGSISMHAEAELTSTGTAPLSGDNVIPVRIRTVFRLSSFRRMPEFARFQCPALRRARSFAVCYTK